MCITQKIFIDYGEILEVTTVEVLSPNRIMVGVDPIDLYVLTLLSQDGKKVLGHQSIEQVMVVLGWFFIIDIPPPVGEHISVTESPLTEEA